MLAVKAFYENGSIQWVEKPPVERAEILVVFPAESSHFKPDDSSLDAVKKAFDQLPQSVFRRDFQGYLPFVD